MTYTLSDLGWSSHFMMQLSIEQLESLAPARIISVHKNAYSALCETGPIRLIAKPDGSQSITVGDWVMADETGLIVDRLDRLTSLSRRAAGEDAREQMIAANVDVLFIVTSCNSDFNPARLERYLVLASAAGCQPVCVLTKPDLCDDHTIYEQKAQGLGADLPVLTVDARDPAQAAQLTDWWRKGQTAALLGSSGVGKSTLAATLTGEDIFTQGIRDDDAKGRHTTTARHMYQAQHGGWLLDTPGMRALRLTDVSGGIGEVFNDLASLAEECRFRDCAHVAEPGCAIQAGINAGDIDPDRLKRWQKLLHEDVRNSETLSQSRSRSKATTMYHKRVIEDGRTRKKR